VIAIIMSVGRSQLQADKGSKFVLEGYLEPLVSVEIRSKVPGEIKKIFVDEGDYVEKGQELLKIDDEEIIEEYKQAEANYEAKQAELEQTIKSNALEIDETQAEIKRYEISLEAAQAELAATKAESLMSVAEPEAEVERAGMNLISQRASSLRQISHREAEIARTRSRLERDKISLTQAQIHVEQAMLSEEPAKVELQNAEAELNRKQDLRDKKFASEKDLEEAQSGYTAAKSRYDSIQKNIQQAQSQVQTQQESLRNGERDLQVAENDLALAKQIHALDDKQAEFRVQSAENRLTLRKAYYAAREKRDEIGHWQGIKMSQAQLTWLRKRQAVQKNVNELEVASAQAWVRQAKSHLDKAQKRLDNTIITAPISGTITRRMVEEGEVIYSYGDVTMEIADLGSPSAKNSESKMIVRAYVNEADIDKVKVGQSAEVRVTAYAERIFAGKVRSVFPRGRFKDEILAIAADEKYVWCGTTKGISRYDKDGAWTSFRRIVFEAEIEIESLPREIRPGMTADVEITTE
jgi:HlyD family secretion protein